MVKTRKESRSSPPAAPMHLWECPTQPWSRLHLDFAGHYTWDKSFSISWRSFEVDAWMDVQIMQSITTAKIIEKLRIIF